jgi:hypothetical protein
MTNYVFEVLRLYNYLSAHSTLTGFDLLPLNSNIRRRRP